MGLRVHTGQGAQVDTTTASGRVVFGIFAALAEFERELIGERTVAGLKAVRARGRKGGRKLALSKAQVRLAQAAMANRDTSVSEPCRELGIKPVTLCRYVGPRGQKVHLSRRVEATDFGLDAGDPAWSLLVLYPLTASRRALPALNAGAFEAAMVIGSPVCGLGPCRAVRARVENVPNPAMATVSPLARASEMVENTASMTLSAAPLDREASAATRDESSDLLESAKIRGVKRRDRLPSEGRASVRGRRLDVQPSMSATLTPRIWVLPDT